MSEELWQQEAEDSLGFISWEIGAWCFVTIEKRKVIKTPLVYRETNLNQNEEKNQIDFIIKSYATIYS
mgnify:CR=1 FL=1